MCWIPASRLIHMKRNLRIANSLHIRPGFRGCIRAIWVPSLEKRDARKYDYHYLLELQFYTRLLPIVGIVGKEGAIRDLGAKLLPSPVLQTPLCLSEVSVPSAAYWKFESLFHSDRKCALTCPNDREMNYPTQPSLQR
ncbi:hypothetical protein VTK73DRAFT_8968 [Phialemonium thermophilum]|uniref:Uncharacterized protein n=1 Tax=Phialemonium thermophilum TaxID=223376 RepID=A0ABR3Y533_9PEZI